MSEKNQTDNSKQYHDFTERLDLLYMRLPDSNILFMLLTSLEHIVIR